MAKLDEDGMPRVNMRWTIEGAKGTRTGMLYGLHAGEVTFAQEAARKLARRGDTVTFELI